MKCQKLVAVVDDDPAMLRAIGRLLRLHGFRSEAFASAEAFLDRGSRHNFVCLILDIHLGGISGIELGYRLKAIRSQVPIVFMTAVDDEAARQAAMGLGCIAYLTKPFSAELLIGAVGGAKG